MILRKILFFTTLLFFFSNNIYAYANDKIAYIDVDFILNNSILGKTILNNLKNLSKKNIDKITLLENELKKENSEITKIKNIISSEEFNDRAKLLKDKINKYKSLKDKLSNEMNNNKKIGIKNFFEKVNPIIEDYMDNKSIDIIIEKKNIFIARSDYDITNDILNLINLKLK